MDERAGRLHLTGEMNIYSAVQLGRELLTTLRVKTQALVVDLSAVTEFDTAGLQLLLLLRRQAFSTQREFSLLNPSDCVSEVLNLCGLQGLVQVKPRRGKRS